MNSIFFLFPRFRLHFETEKEEKGVGLGVQERNSKRSELGGKQQPGASDPPHVNSQIELGWRAHRLFALLRRHSLLVLVASL